MAIPACISLAFISSSSDSSRAPESSTADIVGEVRVCAEDLSLEFGVSCMVLGAVTVCRPPSATDWPDSSLVFPFPWPRERSLVRPNTTLPTLARPIPGPAFVDGAFTAPASPPTVDDSTPILFLREKYPEGLLSDEEVGGGGGSCLGGWKNAFLLGDNGFGFVALADSPVGMASVETVVVHFPANAIRFAGFGLSPSGVPFSLLTEGFGRFLGDGRVVGGASATRFAGFGLSASGIPFSSPTEGFGRFLGDGRNAGGVAEGGGFDFTCGPRKRVERLFVLDGDVVLFGVGGAVEVDLGENEKGNLETFSCAGSRSEVAPVDGAELLG
jgi:hypothetical protein